MNNQCSHSESRVWKALRGALHFDNRIHVFLIAVVTFLFPLGEGLLASVVTSTPAGSDPRYWSVIGLGILVVLHLVLGILVTMRSASVAPDLLAEAVESQNCCTGLRKELNRREQAYRMVREAFDSLNEETCAIDPFCGGGFETGLRPVMQKITKDIHTVLGVRGAMFTVEVYFAQGYVPYVLKDGKRLHAESSLFLEYFYGPEFDRATVEKFTPMMIALPAWVQKVAKQQTVDDDRGVFYNSDTGRLRDDVYFKKFALHPIRESCSGNQVGILLLTSQQTEAFAGDVIETLAFIASLLSRYVFAYRSCVFNKFGTHDENVIQQHLRLASQQRPVVQPVLAQRPAISTPRPPAPPTVAPSQMASAQSPPKPPTTSPPAP